MGVSIRAYARMRGCSESAVRKAITSKRIKPEADGTIDPERANKQWEQNTFLGATLRPSAAKPAPPPPAQQRMAVPSVAGVESPSSDPVQSFLRARAVKETFNAKVAQMEYEERAGRLIQASRAAEYASTFSSIVKDHLMAMPDRLAPVLAAVDDEDAIHKILFNDVSAVLKKLSKAVADAGL
jgi:hypothetical protein